MVQVKGHVESQPPPEDPDLASANGFIVIFPLAGASGRQVLFTAHSTVQFPTFVGDNIACDVSDPTGTRDCDGSVGDSKFELKVYHAQGGTFETFSGSIKGGPRESTPFNGSGSFNLT